MFVDPLCICSWLCVHPFDLLSLFWHVYILPRNNKYITLLWCLQNDWNQDCLCCTTSQERLLLVCLGLDCSQICIVCMEKPGVAKQKMEDTILHEVEWGKTKVNSDWLNTPEPCNQPVGRVGIVGKQAGQQPLMTGICHPWRKHSDQTQVEVEKAESSSQAGREFHCGLTAKT